MFSHSIVYQSYVTYVIKNFMNFKKTIKSLLPGIFLFGYSVGTGSVTAMAKAGADYGMSLLWALLLSCLITYFLIYIYGKFTLVTGETAVSAFKKYIHPWVGIFFIVALTVNISGSIIGVMGIIADVSSEWSKSFLAKGISPIFLAVFFIALVYVLFLIGKNDVFQKVLTGIISLMALCFLINFFLLHPPVKEIISGLVPKIPDVGSQRDAFLVIASMVGTTVFSGLFLMRGSLVKQANWTLADLKRQQKDAAFSAFMMFAVSAAIMAAAAGTLHVKGIKLENVSEMVTILEPFGGKIAVGIFAIGLIAAGVSSQFPNITLSPWLIDDYHERPQDMRRGTYRILALILSLLGLIVPIYKAKPIAVMMASQAFGALILPATVGAILYLGNRKDLMKEAKFGGTINLFLWLILLFAIAMSYMSLSGLF